MLLMFIFVAGVAVALIRRRLLAAPDDPMRSQDAPARLLGWAVGLLAAEREQWGQAMIGELDHLDGRARRWRFALDCVAAAMVMPPWGRAAGALGSLMAVAASAGGLALYTHVHYRLATDGWTWAWAAILVVFLVGYLLGGNALLRRRGVAGPGLVGGLLVAATWLAVGGFTFDRWLNSLWSHWWLLFLAPVVVGVGGTLWGGSAAVGRRAARLAAVTAALTIYLYGVLAVAVLGAAGHDPSDGWTPAQVVGDNLGNQAAFYLMALPLMTATIGWAAAAATARLRPAQPVLVPASPVLPAPGPGPAPTATTHVTPTQSHPTAPGDRPASTNPHPSSPPGAIPTATRQRRIWYLLLLCAALVSAAVLVFLAWLRS
ncbi:hypothetical protein [Micromonospora sp. SL4-19]|uniref:hypothetical protein n=1 Tax=Micromonospora sp. SL4-19 TaxID=3399129 RepID=UPI003A4D50F9